MKRLLVIWLLLAGGAAWAGLDEAPTSGDAAAVQTTQAQTAAGVAYNVVHRTQRTGVVIDEYVDAAGKVFAVSWSGPFKPDLKRLLGRYFDALGAGNAAHRGRRSRVEVNTGDLVVQSGGHMGAFEGRAWVQSRLPAGFDPQEMK